MLAKHDFGAVQVVGKLWRAGSFVADVLSDFVPVGLGDMVSVVFSIIRGKAMLPCLVSMGAGLAEVGEVLEESSKPEPFLVNIEKTLGKGFCHTCCTEYQWVYYVLKRTLPKAMLACHAPEADRLSSLIYKPTS